jgi:GT2 family glycosyltransferase
VTTQAARRAVSAETGAPASVRVTPLRVPTAVRLIDLDVPLNDVWLPHARDGRPYRSLLAIARLNGDPLGAATFPLGPGGRLSRHELERGLPRLHRGSGIEPYRSGGAPRAPTSSVSVVVTTCRNPLALGRCLRSVVECDYDDFELIVVENRPGSGATRLVASQFRAPGGVRYVEESRAGLSRARNAGLAAARGELVAFTDDDTVVDPGWIRRFAERFERQPDLECVTGLILPLELETESQLVLEQFAGFGKGFRRRTHRIGEPGCGGPVYPYAPGAIGSGANTVVRRATALELGGFDRTLGAGTPAAGGEDLDLYVRLITCGHTVGYEPSAIVWHQHPDGRDRLRSQVYRYGVGLGAMLTKQLIRGPARRELVRSVPAGLRYATDPASRKNAAKGAGYPRRLDWLERGGMLLGPAAYVLSAVRARGSPRLEAAPASGWRRRVRLTDKRSIPVTSFGREGPGAAAGTSRSPGAIERTLPAAATLACIVAPLAVALGLPSGLRLAAVLALLCLAPGTALVSALGGRTEPGLIVAASLACSALVAQSMLWLGAWWPSGSVFVLAAVCLPVLWLRPRRRRRRELAWPRVPADIAAHIAVIAAAIAAWAAALLGADVGRMAGIGLLDALPITYFLGIAVLLGGFAAAVTRSPLSPGLLGAYVLALVVVLHGSTPLLYDEPRYPWTYPHLGVISSIAESGGVDRDVDIYSNWPGFLALGGWLSRATGLAPGVYAEWAQVFFNLANVAAVQFALRGATGDQRLLWTATWLFVLGNWVGQDYLAPQSFAFVLAVVVLGLALRVEVPARVPRTRPGLWLADRIGRLRRLLPHGRHLPEPRPSSPLSPRGALLVGGLCYLAVVVSHQLTPMVLLAAIAALALVARRVPLWVPLVMAVAQVAWLGLAWPYLSEHYTLFDPDPTSSAAPPGHELGRGLPGLSLVAHAARAEVLLLAGLALVGIARRLRTRRWDLALAVLMVAPVLIIGLNSYGGEGRYRFYLFALPWLCFFAAVACAPAASTRLRGTLRQWRLVLVTAGVAACTLFAYFGLELSNHVRAADVDAAVWFERNAPADSLLVGLTPSFPRRLTARYPDVYDPAHPGAPALTDHVAFRGPRLGPSSLPRLESTLAGYGARHTFLIITPVQKQHVRLFGLAPPGSPERLARALGASRAFRVVYERGAASIFRYEGRAR